MIGRDTAAMIDPTKLKRAAFIAALQGWYLANFDETDVQPVLDLLRANALQRSRETLRSQAGLDIADQQAVATVKSTVEIDKVKSISQFASLGQQQLMAAESYIAALNELTSGFDSHHSPVRSNDRVYRPLLLLLLRPLLLYLYIMMPYFVSLLNRKFPVI